MTLEQLQVIIAAKSPESITLDYKQELPPDTQDGKREFLQDLTAMANTHGGQILYGIEEERDGSNRPTGTPLSATGVAVENFDAWKLRTLQWIRDSSDPPVHNVTFEQVGAFPLGPVIAARIPRSWNAPHRVRIKEQSYFYMRTDSGNVPMDAAMIRQSFLLGSTAMDRMRAFREDRTSRILTGQAPTPLDQGPIFLCHIFPLQAFASDEAVDLQSADDGHEVLKWFGGHPLRYRYNFDGLLGVEQRIKPHFCGYAQVLRNGCIEGVEVHENRPEYPQRLAGHYWEVQQTPSFVHRNLATLKRLGITPPIFVFMTWLHAAGWTFSETADLAGSYRPFPSDLLQLPSIRLDETELGDIEVKDKLQPAFDVMWQAIGISGSPYGGQYR